MLVNTLTFKATIEDCFLEKEVKVVSLSLHVYECIQELRVYFDGSWQIQKDGYLYGNPMFLKEVRNWLENKGLPGSEICYADLNYQGNDYVAFDVSFLLKRLCINRQLEKHPESIDVYYEFKDDRYRLCDAPSFIDMYH